MREIKNRQNRAEAPLTAPRRPVYLGVLPRVPASASGASSWSTRANGGIQLRLRRGGIWLRLWRRARFALGRGGSVGGSVPGTSGSRATVRGRASAAQTVQGGATGRFAARWGRRRVFVEGGRLRSRARAQRGLGAG